MANLRLRLIILLVLACSFPKTTLSGWWFSSSPPPSSSDFAKQSQDYQSYGGGGAFKSADFSMQAFNPGPNAIKVVEDAKTKMLATSTCWYNAYRALMESCSEIVADEEKKRKLAWLLGNCFQTTSGRPAFPACKKDAAMVHCLKRLDDGEHNVFLEFFLETNNICHQLQSELFKQETEMAVNHLAKSAHSQLEKLDIMGEISNQLLQDSSQALDLVSSVHERAEQALKTSGDIEAHIHDLSKNSQAMLKQSSDISASQLELMEAHADMNAAFKTGMSLLHESYESLGKGMNGLMNETVRIEKGVKLLGESMVSKMQELQGTADSIETVASSSLEKQMQLIDGQSEALEGLQSLRKFQSEALKESRDTLEKFSEYGHKQHEELIRRQEEIQKTHDHLYQTSQAILEAQREFELKQSDIFSMLEKLYALYKAILDESRFIKGFFYYACVSFLLYMLTSAKQTSMMRAYLYLGLCVAMLLEMTIIKLGISDVTKNVCLVRFIFMIVAAFQLIYSICNYIDYEGKSLKLLQTLVEKVAMLEQNSGRLGGDDGDDDSFSDYSWIDEELPEDMDLNEDPDYFPREVGVDFSTAAVFTKSYHLRPRHCNQH